MRLDPRVADVKDIGNPFNAGDFEQYKGKKCYVAPTMETFSDLSKCTLETLEEVEPYFTYPYETESDTWKFCLPAELVTPSAESRAFTLEEFRDKFLMQSFIKFRKKDDKEVEIYTVFTGYGKNGPKACVYLGPRAWFLEELFDEYEWWDPNSDSWNPFGVGS